jgi:hypothetical protein
MADIFGIPEGYFGAGAGALGAGADVYSFLQQQQQRDAMQKIYSILSNPQKLAAYVGKFFQPMGAAENTAVQRDLGANWATMTGGAPGGAMNQFIADALAKIESQRYQSATGSAIDALRGAQGSAAGFPNTPGGNLGGIMKSLQILKQLRGGGESSGIADIPGYQDYRAGERAVYPAPTTYTADQTGV